MSHNSHALATTSKRGLNNDWEANLLTFREKELWVLVVTVIARHNGYLRISHNKLRFRFGTHGMNRLGRRSYENDLFTLELCDELGILREETISRMNCF
jgi:hypothetical protein